MPPTTPRPPLLRRSPEFFSIKRNLATILAFFNRINPHLADPVAPPIPDDLLFKINSLPSPAYVKKFLSINPLSSTRLVDGRRLSDIAIKLRTASDTLVQARAFFDDNKRALNAPRPAIPNSPLAKPKAVRARFLSFLRENEGRIRVSLGEPEHPAPHIDMLIPAYTIHGITLGPFLVRATHRANNHWDLGLASLDPITMSTSGFIWTNHNVRYTPDTILDNITNDGYVRDASINVCWGTVPGPFNQFMSQGLYSEAFSVLQAVFQNYSHWDAYCRLSTWLVPDVYGAPGFGHGTHQNQNQDPPDENPWLAPRPAPGYTLPPFKTPFGQWKKPNHLLPTYHTNPLARTIRHNHMPGGPLFFPPPPHPFRHIPSRPLPHHFAFTHLRRPNPPLPLCPGFFVPFPTAPTPNPTNPGTFICDSCQNPTPNNLFGLHQPTPTFCIACTDLMNPPGVPIDHVAFFTEHQRIMLRDAIATNNCKCASCVGTARTPLTSFGYDLRSGYIFCDTHVNAQGLAAQRAHFVRIENGLVMRTPNTRFAPITHPPINPPAYYHIRRTPPLPTPTTPGLIQQPAPMRVEEMRPGHFVLTAHPFYWDGSVDPHLLQDISTRRKKDHWRDLRPSMTPPNITYSDNPDIRNRLQHLIDMQLIPAPAPFIFKPATLVGPVGYPIDALEVVDLRTVGDVDHDDTTPFMIVTTDYTYYYDPYSNAFFETENYEDDDGEAQHTLDGLQGYHATREEGLAFLPFFKQWDRINEEPIEQELIIAEDFSCIFVCTRTHYLHHRQPERITDGTSTAYPNDWSWVPFSTHLQRVANNSNTQFPFTLAWCDNTSEFLSCLAEGSIPCPPSSSHLPSTPTDYNFGRHLHRRGANSVRRYMVPTQIATLMPTPTPPPTTEPPPTVNLDNWMDIFRATVIATATRVVETTPVRPLEAATTPPPEDIVTAHQRAYRLDPFHNLDATHAPPHPTHTVYQDPDTIF